MSVNASPEQRKFPELKADSIPAVGHGGAWIVQEVHSGWVFMLSADLKGKLKMPIDRFNRHVDDLLNAAKLDLLTK